MDFPVAFFENIAVHSAWPLNILPVRSIKIDKNQTKSKDAFRSLQRVHLGELPQRLRSWPVRKKVKALQSWNRLAANNSSMKPPSVLARLSDTLLLQGEHLPQEGYRTRRPAYTIYYKYNNKKKDTFSLWKGASPTSTLGQKRPYLYGCGVCGKYRSLWDTERKFKKKWVPSGCEYKYKIP